MRFEYQLGREVEIKQEENYNRHTSFARIWRCIGVKEKRKDNKIKSIEGNYKYKTIVMAIMSYLMTRQLGENSPESST